MTASATGPQPSGRAIRHWKPTAEKSPAGYAEHPESSPGGAWVPFPLETAVIMAGPRGAAAPEPQGRRTGPALLSAAPALSFGVGIERRADSPLRIPLLADSTLMRVLSPAPSYLFPVTCLSQATLPRFQASNALRVGGEFFVSCDPCDVCLTFDNLKNTICE